MSKTARKIFFISLILLFAGCGPKPSVDETLAPAPGERIDFFPTAQRARDDIASLIHQSENRVDASFAAAEDSTIVNKEIKYLEELQEEELTTYEDLISTLDNFLLMLPPEGRMETALSKGRGNLIAKFDSYNKSLDAVLFDQILEALEKTAVESNARSLITELQFIESNLPLPVDSLEIGPTFLIEEDSVDLFFEIKDDIEDMTKEINQLKATLRQYQKSKEEMEAFLDREKMLNQRLEEHTSEIDKLFSSIDTTRQEQEKAFVTLDTKIASEKDTLTKIIQQLNSSFQGDISQIVMDITDSLSTQQEQSDSLFFQLGTNLQLFKSQMDSLKGVVRFYDVAEKGLPILDEEVLNILKLPLLRHKITLKNGTIVIGQILTENLDVIVIQTSMGKLVIEKDFIAKYNEKTFPGPKIVIDDDYQVEIHREYEEFTGTVRNIGNKRADFVKVTFMLWGKNTNSIGVGSGYIDGKTFKFSTGVISDASIGPDETARFTLRVEKRPGAKTSYRTTDVTWREFE